MAAPRTWRGRRCRCQFDAEVRAKIVAEMAAEAEVVVEKKKFKAEDRRGNGRGRDGEEKERRGGARRRESPLRKGGALVRATHPSEKVVQSRACMPHAGTRPHAVRAARPARASE